MQDQPSGICECGCGQRTSVVKGTDSRRGIIKGQYRRFVQGHTGAAGPQHTGPAYIEDENGCWIWQHYVDPRGYGRDRRARMAYAVVWEAHNGPVPEGLELDHLCRNRACVNPAHLEPVTHAENMRRGYWGAKTHCPQGHPYTEENTYRRARGGRECWTCIRERQRRQRKGTD